MDTHVIDRYDSDWPEKMRVAKSTDWKTEAMPLTVDTVRLNRIFSRQEIDDMQKGLLPEQQEDKWFVYWDDDTLYFHRSWTGFCIYVVRFASDGDSYRMTEATVNRDSQQYSATDDPKDAKMISYLIDVLLLRKHTALPSDTSYAEDQAIKNWSLVGRAMFDQHPDSE